MIFNSTANNNLTYLKNYPALTEKFPRNMIKINIQDKVYKPINMQLKNPFNKLELTILRHKMTRIILILIIKKTKTLVILFH